MRRLLRENGLSIVFLALFVVALVLQAIAGHALFNDEQQQHSEPPIGFWRYVLSSSYLSAVMENWQSEYLQFTLFILLTVWLLQKGSPELKPLHEAGRESDSDQQIGRHAGADAPRWGRVEGLRRVIFENSLLILRG
ncbi:MAG TPA: DUF6766 family protein [Thermoleophilaceae bacterium]|nr:DUF6766 family protein [Thermoleophilaceae bacterium]